MKEEMRDRRTDAILKKIRKRKREERKEREERESDGAEDNERERETDERRERRERRREKRREREEREKKRVKMVGKNDGSINAGLKEIIQIIQAVAQGSSVYYIMRESWLVLQLGTNSNFCRRCNATGRIVCNKCKGTSTLRRRPAAFSTLSDQMVSPSDSTYKCPWSGPRGTFDIPPTADQLEDSSSYRVHLAEEVEDVLKQGKVASQ